MKLNKKVLASLIAAGILTTGTALANPFDDVPQGHWSYDAVQSLADQGIIDGFGDGTYRGDKLMTRYEMAQIVGRAVSKAKEENATLEKLVNEYAEELQSLGVKVAALEKKTAGVSDLKINHWFQMENTYGSLSRQIKSEKGESTSANEYMLKYRFSLEKQISPKLSIFHQLETKTDYFNTTTQNVGISTNRDGVITRMAYVTYNPDDKTTMRIGKDAYWLAGGLLGDDYVNGISITRKVGKDTTVQAMTGRYWVKSVDDTRAASDFTNNATLKEGTSNSNISYLGVNTKFGTVDFGAHYVTGQISMATGQMGVGYDPDRTDGGLKDRSTSVWAVTAATDLGNSGVNLSLGYGKDTKEDNDNDIQKIQLYKKFGKTDVFLQYWKEGKNYGHAMENGNHTAWWGDQYSGNGVKGWRFIAVHPWSANSYSEFYYGDYKRETAVNGEQEKGKKYGFSLTFMY